jgi:hypothetical protein
LAFVDDEIGDGLVRDLQRVVGSAGLSRAWSLAPPEFVDSTDPEGARTVGCLLPLHGTHDEQGEAIPSNLDRASYADTAA